MADRIENLVDESNALVQRLKVILDELEENKVDMLADAELRVAVNNHIALDLKPINGVKVTFTQD